MTTSTPPPSARGRLHTFARGGAAAQPDFRRLWAAQSVSWVGSLISRTAIPWLAILVLDASPWEIAALGLASLVPAFVLGLVAGAWVDRLPRRPILVAADLGRAALLASVPAMAWAGVLRFEALLAVAVAMSALDICFDVASQALLPAIVPETDLLDANRRLSASGSVAEVSAFSASGWLVQALTAPGAVLIDAASYVWSAWMIRGISLQETAVPPESRAPLAAEVAAGLRLVWSTPALRAIAAYGVTLDLGFQLFGTVFMIYVTRDLGFAPGPLGMIFALGGIAALAGAALAGRVDTRLGLRSAVVVMTLLIAAGQGAIALATTAGTVAIALLVAQQLLVDGPWTVADVLQATVRQSAAPLAWQGRVTATLRVLSFGAMAIGALLGGWIGDTLGARTGVVVAASVCAAAIVPAVGMRVGSVNDGNPDQASPAPISAAPTTPE